MRALLEHLDGQLASAQRMLKILLAQTDAIRRQDVESVLARLSEIQGELVERERLERDRDALLREAAGGLGLSVDELTLEDLLVHLAPADAAAARARSAELKGLLGEVQRVHEQNRLLIRQELSFLDHLMRLLSGAPQGAYTAGGYTPAATPALSTLNVRA